MKQAAWQIEHEMRDMVAKARDEATQAAQATPEYQHLSKKLEEAKSVEQQAVEMRKQKAFHESMARKFWEIGTRLTKWKTPFRWSSTGYKPTEDRGEYDIYGDHLYGKLAQNRSAPSHGAHLVIYLNKKGERTKRFDTLSVNWCPWRPDGSVFDPAHPGIAGEAGV